MIILLSKKYGRVAKGMSNLEEMATRIIGADNTFGKVVGLFEPHCNTVLTLKIITKSKPYLKQIEISPNSW